MNGWKCHCAHTQGGRAKEFLSADSYPLGKSRLRGDWVKAPAEEYQGTVFKPLQL